jgi:shikimate dehydrogenase
MHNAALEYLGIPCVFLSFEPDEKDLSGVFTGMRALGIRFFSVTKPFKQAVMPFLDDVDPVAKAIGAVNSVLNENGKLTGYNSDWIGVSDVIEEAAPLAGKKILLLGTGGAGRAAAYAYKEKGARVFVYNRTKEKAASLAAEFNLAGFGSMEDLLHEEDWDLIVNTTSVGMAGSGTEGQSPVPAEFLKKTARGNSTIILDAVIFPQETILLKTAASMGCVCLTGARMMLLQSLFQFELYTGKKPPLEVMWDALQKAFSA